MIWKSHPNLYTTGRTHKALLGTLDGSKTGVWADLLFADPVADIAVSGCPDSQDFFDEAEASDALTNEAPALQVRQARNGTGWILSLDGHWVRTELEVQKGMHGISLQTGPTDTGMSGSPILNDNGRAVGVVVIGIETVHQATGEWVKERAGPQPILTRNLPGWLLQQGSVFPTH